MALWAMRKLSLTPMPPNSEQAGVGGPPFRGKKQGGMDQSSRRSPDWLSRTRRIGFFLCHAELVRHPVLVRSSSSRLLEQNKCAANCPVLFILSVLSFLLLMHSLRYAFSFQLKIDGV